MKAGHGPGAGRHGSDRPGDESLGTELPFARYRAGADATGLPVPAAGGDRGLSRGHTGGGQRSGVRPEGRLLPKQRLQPAVHNRGTGKADGRACRLDDLPPLSLEHGPALPWDSRHTALPVYQSDELWSAAGEVAGRVLYDRGGETFRAPYHSIPPPTDIRASMDSGTFSGHFLCPLRRSTGGAMWSMPPMKFLTQNTEMCWIAGSITAIRTDFCNTRQNGTGENRMSNHGAFRTVWSDLRYGPEVTPPVIKKNDQRNGPPAKAGGSF